MVTRGRKLVAAAAAAAAAGPSGAACKWFKVCGYAPGATVPVVQSAAPDCLVVNAQSAFIGLDGCVAFELCPVPILPCGGCPAVVDVTLDQPGGLVRLVEFQCTLCSGPFGLFALPGVDPCVPDICTTGAGDRPGTALDVTPCAETLPSATCESAFPIADGATSFTNTHVSSDVEFSCGLEAGVWYEYVASGDGTLVVSTCGSAFDTSLELYAGCDCAGLDLLACSNDSCGEHSRVATPAAGGECFMIHAGGDQGAQGDGVIRVEIVEPPPGDCVGAAHELLAPDGAANDSFGASVSVSGDAIVAGAFGHDEAAPNAGAAYVFRADAAGWVHEQELAASDAGPDQLFGTAVSIDGDRILVGAPSADGVEAGAGAAYVFRHEAAAWVQEAKIIAADGGFGDAFGWSVALEGDFALVGARGDDEAAPNAGAAYVFRRDGETWVQEAKLLASAGTGSDFFGERVALDGDRVVVGTSVGSAEIGYAGVFRREGTAWVPEATLVPTDGAGNQAFGRAVAVRGDVAAVGAPGDDEVTTDAGAVYVFARDPATGAWSQLQKLVAAGPAAFDIFGISVALGDAVIVIGASSDDDALPDAGAAYLFVRSDAGSPADALDDFWLEHTQLTAPGAEVGDELGRSVGLEGARLVLGAWRADGAGAAYAVGTTCPCPEDFDGDGAVGITDFLHLLAAWGPNPGDPADLDGDGTVGIFDLLALLAAWGACPTLGAI